MTSNLLVMRKFVGGDVLFYLIVLNLQHGRTKRRLQQNASILWSLAYEVAVRVYENHAVATSFDCKAMSNSWELKSAHATLAKILEEITGVQPGQDCEDVEEQLASELGQHLKGKRFLIVVCSCSITDEQQLKRLLDALFRAADGCQPGSTIIITTR
jgi:hypothetical protein